MQPTEPAGGPAVSNPLETVLREIFSSYYSINNGTSNSAGQPEALTLLESKYFPANSINSGTENSVSVNSPNVSEGSQPVRGWEENLRSRRGRQFESTLLA